MNPAELTQPPTTVPAPDQPVPAEFDLLCEHCGYSLVGLIGSNRCPECGETFDPTLLPLARIPWLYRKRLGSWMSYIQTVWLVLFQPATFARELCRPVRISHDDARAFRRRSIWIAVVTFFIGAVALSGLLLYSMIRLYSTMVPTAVSTWQWVGYGVRLVIFSVIGAAAVMLLLRMATDQPTFIWKGLADAPNELAPAQHYAAAPLALAPLLGIFILAIGGYALSISESRFEQAIQMSFIVAGGIMVFLLMVTAIIFMRVTSRSSRVRMLFLSLYLPFHYALMFAVAVMAGGLVGGLANTIMNELGLRLF
jgi:hypothetical protein